MKNTTKLALAAVVLATVTSAQAQYNGNDELLLGFTTSASKGDLIIDLGTFSNLGSGDLNTSGSGKSGFSNTGLQTSLGLNGLSLNSLSWGVVGGHYLNGNPGGAAVYWTVGHGLSAGTVPASGGVYGIPTSAIDTAGGNIVSGNTAVVDPTTLSGTSWREAISPGAGAANFVTSWGKDPDSTTSATFGTGLNYQMEDLYRATSGQTTPTLLGTLQLGSDGSLSFAPVAVPEPTTYSILAGFGLLALVVRRQFARNNA